MAQIINTNLASINTQRHLSGSLNDLRTAIERLSSGKRINSAKDDAAGLAVATRMDSLVRGMAVCPTKCQRRYLHVPDGRICRRQDFRRP